MKHFVVHSRRREAGVMTTDDSELLTIAEATRLLKVGRTTLHRWLKSGRLRAYQVGPKAVRIRRGDLNTVMKLTYGEGVTDVKEAQPIPVQTTLAAIHPMTEEQKQRALAALEQSRQLGERILARRGGKPIEESWPMIREAREERSTQQQ
jgi:excisionase family DNA binding protein